MFEYITWISSRKELLRTIDEYIGDIRFRLMLVRGLDITEVTPLTFTAVLNGSTTRFPSNFDLNLLKNFNHHGDPMQFPINAVLPPETPLNEWSPTYNRAYRRPDQRYIQFYVHHMASDRAERLLRPRLGRTILPSPYAWNTLSELADVDFDDYIRFIDHITLPVETTAYNATTDKYLQVSLFEPSNLQPNRVYTGFHDSDCYQRKHKRHYIGKNMYKFPFTVTVTLPVSQTSWWLGDVSKNGLFVIGGSWDIDTWDPQNILHYTCVYQPSHDWYVRNTQQRKMLLNHAIVRMVPYEPHCRIHWDHFDTWRTYARGITRSAIVGEMDHRRVGKVRSHSREFGHNLRATHTYSEPTAVTRKSSKPYL